MLVTSVLYCHFKALVVGSIPTQPNYCYRAPKAGGAAIEAIPQAVEHNKMSKAIPAVYCSLLLFFWLLWPT
jgi:hypothetical protein